MNPSQMLSDMCYEDLSNADVKAIAKARGFSAKETASRALFENFFLSEIGVESAMASLTAEEIALLHLLKYTGETVDVAVFERIYRDEGTTGRRYYRTFTQRYKDVFKKVRLSLVRKGLLLMAEDPLAWDAKTKMERWRFRFPREFEPFLPPVVRSTTTLEGGGDVRSDVPRRKLMEIVTGRQPDLISSNKQYDLKLVGGRLMMGGEPFQAKLLKEWQHACWQASAPSPNKRAAWPVRSEVTVSPVEATTYVLAQLEENEWIRPGQLSIPLRVFCAAHLSGEDICAAGWKWGCLAKREVNGKQYYRLPAQEAWGQETGPSVDPKDYLTVASDRSVVVDLKTIPYQSLEHLALISKMRPASSGQPHLTAVPNLIRMGNASESLRDQPLTVWLRENAPAYREALETVQQRWGKQIIHENLLIARVGDVALRVQLERSFSGSVVFLPNDYIAFPRDLTTAVERAVTRAGYVIRTVEPNG